jgi:hypothetical protein
MCAAPVRPTARPLECSRRLFVRVAGDEARDPAAANSFEAEAGELLPHVDSAVTLPCFAVPHPVVPAPR